MVKKRQTLREGFHPLAQGPFLDWMSRANPQRNNPVMKVPSSTLFWTCQKIFESSLNKS